MIVLRQLFFWCLLLITTVSLMAAAMSSIRLSAVMELRDVVSLRGGGAGSGTGRLEEEENQKSLPPSAALAPSKSLMEKAHDLFVAMIYKSEIPGMPGKDYPILADIPSTHFRCQDHSNVGYYADVESGCQVIHVCLADGSHESFLCPNGTIFNQQYFVCDWWFNVDCSESPTFYDLNGGFGKVSEKNYYQEPAEKVSEKDYFEESKIVEVKRTA